MVFMRSVVGVGSVSEAVFGRMFPMLLPMAFAMLLLVFFVFGVQSQMNVDVLRVHEIGRAHV